MKKLAFISGAIGFSLTLIGIMFKVQHWAGASIILSLGFILLALVYVPSIAKYLYDKE